MVDKRVVEYGSKKYLIALEAWGNGSDFQFADNFKLTRGQIAKLAGLPDPVYPSDSVDIIMIASKVVDIRSLVEANDASSELIASLTQIAKQRLSANPTTAPNAEQQVAAAVSTAKRQAQVVVAADKVATEANVVGATGIATQAQKVLTEVTNAPLDADISHQVKTINNLTEKLQQITPAQQ